MGNTARLESNLTDYLRGKRVAIIGRAQELRSLKQGDFIDSHDIVVRVNNPVPYALGANREAKYRIKQNKQWEAEFLASPVFVPAWYHDRLGSKTSIYFLNDRQFASDVFEDDSWCKTICKRLVYAGCNHFIISQPIRLSLLQKHCTVFDITLTHATELYRNTRQFTKTSPNGGTMAISLFSQFDFAQLYISGFSKQATNKRLSNVNGPATNDFRFIKSLVHNNHRIDTDSPMKCQFKTIK